MSKIPDKKLLEHMARGITQLMPDCADALWDQPVTPSRGTEWYLDAPKSQKRKKNHFIGVLAACLILCLISTVLFQFMPSASVYLDVNPSVELRVNYCNRVTKAIPCNTDAEEILSDMDLRGTDLDVALYAVLGSMVHHGYLTEATDTILISVHSANTGRASELEVEVSDMVSQSLSLMIQAGEVLSQQLSAEDVEQLEPGYCASPGKAAFIDDLEDKYPQLEQEDLDHLTVDEILSLLEEDDLDYSDYTDEYDDEDDDEDDDSCESDDDEEEDD